MNDWSHWPVDGPGNANLRKVCAEAIESFEREFRRSPGTADYLSSATSARDVQAAIEELITNCGTLPRDKKAIPKSSMPPRHIVTRLHLFSDQVENFARILEVLAMVSGRNVSVVWEAAIFVLKRTFYHRDLITEFCETFQQVGNALPRCLLSEVHPTGRMVSNVAGLGRHLISVFQRTIQWCNFQNSGRRLFSILKPFKLYDESILKKIHASSRSIDDEERTLLSMRLIHNSNQMSDLEIRQFKLAAHLPLQVDSLYKPLASGKYEIRLLILDPMMAKTSSSTNDAESTELVLQCELHTVALPKAPPYTALSYHWGDQNQTVPIIVNNVEVRITSTLHAALVAVRRATEDVTYVWADALCIDQENLEERSRQVERMRAIYQKASNVVVWLGSGDNLDELITSFSYDQVDPETQISNMNTARELLSRPYWKRVWVIQEVAVASKNISIYYGRHKIAWEDFVYLCKRHFRRDDSSAVMRAEDDILSGLTTLREFRGDILSRKPISMLDALLRSRCSLSTEPRDKLYAILNLAFDGKTFIVEPNYMSSVGECFIDFATALIEHGEPLDFMYLRSANRTNEGDLPSWVPDWTDLGDAVACRQLHHILDCASLRSKHTFLSGKQKATVEIQGTDLIVSGVFVDSITKLGTSFAHSDHEGDEGQAEGLTAEEILREQFGQELNNLFPKEFLKPLGTWLAENHSFINQEYPIRDWSSIFNARLAIVDRSPKSVTRSILDAVKSQMRPVKVVSKRFGWVHPQAQKGDAIFKIVGCSRLVVLRSVRDGYSVIGDAILSYASQLDPDDDRSTVLDASLKYQNPTIVTDEMGEGFGESPIPHTGFFGSNEHEAQRLLIF